MIKGRIKFYGALALAFISLSIPVFFLDVEVLAGIFSILGIFFFLVAIRLLDGKKEFIILLIALWLAQSIRFITIFGLKFSLMMIVAGCFILATIVEGFAIILSKYLEKKKLLSLQVLVFPVTFVLMIMVLVLIGIGNELNLLTYLMLIPGINLNLRYFSEFIFTFILAFMLSALVCLLTNVSKKRKIGSLILVAAMLLALIVNSANITLSAKGADYSLNVAIATQEQYDFYGNTDKVLTKQEKFDVFTNAIMEAKVNNADLLVLSEEYCSINEEDLDESLEFYSNTIKLFGIPTLLCVDILKENDLCINEALFYDSEGNVISSYIKNNLVPFIEAGYYQKGEDDPGYLTYNFDGHEVNISYAVCFDINNDFFISKINEDTELLIDPAWDWDTANEEQKRIRIRSVELNTTVLKHTYDGYSFVATPYSTNCEFIDNKANYQSVTMVKVPIYEKDNND